MDISTVPVHLSDRSYDITIGQNLLPHANRYVPESLQGRRYFVLADEEVRGHASELIGALGGAEFLSIKGGEQAKSWEGLQTVTDWLLDHKVDRKSVLFVVGGGVIGDLGGFAAASVLRGIPFIQVPTTLLAQVDSSVGGKTGINSHHGKNLIGAFYQPRAVLCDLGVLATLPDREIKAGYAEIVKYALINDPAFFDWLEDNAAGIIARDIDVLRYAIETSCRAKAAIVAADEKEEGQRALLNLGHTFAHALEAAAGYDGRLLHGEAVSIGLVLAHRLSVKAGLCGGNAAQAVEDHLGRLGMPTAIPDFAPDADTLMALMQGDKKAEKKQIGFIVTRGIGQAFQNYEIDMNDVRSVLETR
jgi:3-dehydroquinate synthase